MEKLSERFMYYCGLLAAYKVTKNIDINAEDLKHIQDLIDAEEQGLLLRLPCTIEDTIYVLKNNNEIEKGIIKSIIVEKDKITYWYKQEKHYGEWFFTNKSINKTIFYSREEAEQALAEMKEN